MALSEIDKLKARYEENPEGRYFAPLADAYRKSGRIDEAIELVKSGLTRHPDYLSAHIVLGRCFLDKKDDASARQTLEGVLKLDSENIIALKSLAEIAERMGDKFSARKWLAQLLQIDSTNTDAEEDLNRLGGPPAEGEEPPLTEEKAAEAAAAAGVAAAEGLEPTTVTVEPPPVAVTEAVTTPIQAIDLAPPDEREMDEARHSKSMAVPAIDFIDKAGPETAPPRPAPPLLDLPEMEPVPPAAEVKPAELPMLEIESSAGDKPGGGGADWGDAPQDRSVRLSAAMLAGGTEFDSGETNGKPVEQTMHLDAAAATPPKSPADDLPLIMPEDVTPPEELRRPSVKQVATLSPEPFEAPGGSGAPLLTETMGDLYLKQGFRAEAADVFRRLLAQRPGDRGLEAKRAAASAGPEPLSASALGSESVGSFLARVARAGLSGPNPAPAPASEPTPMEQAFAAEPEPAPQPGEPARPASDAFSLDKVFGSEGGQTEAPSAAPPPPSGGASFDEFFGTAPSASGESARPADSAPGQAGAPPTPAEGDDLSSFSSWLHGLKK